MTQPLLELEHVTKDFPLRAGPLRRKGGSVSAVADVSLDVRENEIIGLVGESGCGKTTLAKMICGLERPSAGRIRYGGDRKEIQLVFQDPTSSLDPTQRVGGALEEPLLVHRLARAKSARREEVTRLLKQVGLPPEYARRYPRSLSGGERQRVAIARALAVRPRLLILDEPVASLDVYVGAQVLQLLGRLQQEQRLSYVVISHDLRVIGSMCRRVAVMYLGRIVEVAPAAQLFTAPWHPYTELLLDAAGLRAFPRSSGLPSVAGAEDRGEMPSPLHPPSGCRFRTRCPLAAPVCAEQDPALLEKAPGPETPPSQSGGVRDRRVACHFRP